MTRAPDVITPCWVCGYGRAERKMARLEDGSFVCAWCVSERPSRFANPARRAIALAELKVPQ